MGVVYRSTKLQYQTHPQFAEAMCRGLSVAVMATASTWSESESMFQSVLTVDEVAAVLRVSRHTVYRLAERGELPGRRVGRVWRFSKEGIDRYLLGEGNVAPKNTREDGNASQ